MKKILLLLALWPCISSGRGIDAMFLYGDPLVRIANNNNTNQNVKNLYVIGRAFYNVNETFQLGLGVEWINSGYKNIYLSSNSSAIPVYVEANRIFNLGNLYITGGIYSGFVYDTEQSTFISNVGTGATSSETSHSSGFLVGFDMGLTYDIIPRIGIRAETGVRWYTSNFEDGGIQMPFAAGIVVHL